MGIHEWVGSLPEALDTQVRERGSRFSAGERQLVALGRAFLADPGIVVLDEATSNLDPETEAHVEGALWVLLAGRTAVVIAHRLRSAERADRVVMIDDRRIIADGRHTDLARDHPAYRHLVAVWARRRRLTCGYSHEMSDPTSPRVTVRRLPERGVYDRATIDAILDEALFCHVGFVRDGGPMVIPTIHARLGDTLYLHGSPASRMLRSMRAGNEVCVTVTLVDGLVMARAPFHSSLNYRSVVLLGVPRIVEDDAERRAAFEALTEHVAPGRWADSRQPTDKEFRATLVVAVPIGDASAKVRTGPPADDEDDYGLPIWAGVVPLRTVAGSPVADPRLADGVPVPNYLRRYERPDSRP